MDLQSLWVKKKEHMPVIKSLREDGWIESNAANEVRD